MRIAAQAVLAYVLLLAMGAVWQFLPATPANPEVIALLAVYLGLTARNGVAAPTLGAVLIGYLGDLLLGTPRGMYAFIAAIACVAGHLVHRRLLVRGIGVTIAFSFFIGGVAGCIQLLARLYVSTAPLEWEFGRLLYSALATGAAGPIVFRLCRSVDARFARTHRERDAALEGLIP